MRFLQAFSLIELLVVITIVGILSAIAIPTYDRYIVRTHVTGLVSVADSYKIKLVEEVMTAASARDAVHNLNTDVIEKVTVQTLDTEPNKYIVEVVAKMRTPTQSGIGLKQPHTSRAPLTVQMQGVANGELITWTCHVAEEYYDYVPHNCKNNELEVLRGV